MTEITELEELTAEKVSAVANPANGTPWLLVKAKADPDDMEAILTKGYCATEGCDVCEARFSAEILAKAKLDAKARHALSDSDYAYIDSKGGRHLPVNDAGHVRSALGRFDQTHFESDDAKKAAAKKIEAAAKKFGVKVSDDTDVARAAKDSPGVPAYATETPQEHGHDASTGKSGLAGPMTAGPKDFDEDPSYCLGGEPTYVIPAQQTAQHDPNPKAPKVAKGFEIEVVDKEAWVAEANPGSPEAGVPGSATAAPGDPAWEACDAATLDSVARGLAAASRMVEWIARREATEAMTGNSADWMDACDLECACDDINAALALVARLAYHEAAAEGAVKAGKRLSSASQSSIRSALEVLSHLLGDDMHPKEDDQMTTVTKDELVTVMTSAARDAVSLAMKAQRKQIAKKLRKARKIAKNANNGGDITEATERSGVNGKADANDVDSVPSGGKVDSKYKNTSKRGRSMKSLAKELRMQRERLEKMEARPRPGGPVLDGIARGLAPEGRVQAATKAAEGDIERIAKELEAAKAVRGPEAAARASELSQQLTLLRLREAHAQGIA
ncbi:MAG TPA: DUF6582 domain-containing protein [Mycobacteriales bacterium]